MWKKFRNLHAELIIVPKCLSQCWSKTEKIWMANDFSPTCNEQSTKSIVHWLLRWCRKQQWQWNHLLLDFYKRFIMGFHKIFKTSFHRILTDNQYIASECIFCQWWILSLTSPEATNCVLFQCWNCFWLPQHNLTTLGTISFNLK